MNKLLWYLNVFDIAVDIAYTTKKNVANTKPSLGTFERVV